MNHLKVQGTLAPVHIQSLEKQGYSVESHTNYFNLRLNPRKLEHILGYPLYQAFVDLRDIYKIVNAVFSIDDPIFFGFRLGVDKNSVGLTYQQKFQFLQNHDHLPLTYYKKYSLQAILLSESELEKRFRTEIDIDYREAVDLLFLRIEERFEEELNKIAELIYS